MKPIPPWEDESGVKVLRLYKSKDHPDWHKPVNKKDLHPDWPRVVVLDLDEDQFLDFEANPWDFARNHNLYPEQPILWISSCAKPPTGRRIPRAKGKSRWTAVIVHTHGSGASCAAAPQ
jgi:hypothetical protein